MREGARIDTGSTQVPVLKEGDAGKKVKRSWVLYDVANSAFILLATSVLPIYFNDLAQADDLTETQYLAYWSAAAAIVTVLMLFIGPVVGSASDRRNWRRPLFITTVLIGVLACIGLGFPKWWLAFLIVLVICKIGYNASLVVYDSMLNDIVPEEETDSLSSKGYAVGYIGSIIPFVVCLVFVVFSDMLESTPTYFTFETAVFISLVITGIWWFVMSLPLFRNYEQKRFNEVTNRTVPQALKYTWGTIKDISTNPAVLLFMVAFFFYIDGVNTIIELSIAYGEALGLESIELLAAMLISQFVAFPSTLIMNKLAYKYGTHRIILVSIIGYICISVFALFLTHIWQFYVLACSVGLFQGTIQALSRSYFSRMVPKEKTGEYFGILDVFGKGATILGTFSVAILTTMFNEVRMVAIVLLIMFSLGFLFFHMSVKNRTYDVNAVQEE